MIAGNLIGSVVSGQLISRYGRWKGFLVGGSLLNVSSLSLLGTMTHETPYGILAVGMLANGIAMGMLMQNLVLAVQNTVQVRDIGTASSAVAFFRSIGGAAGVAVLGAVLAERVGTLTLDGMVAAHMVSPDGSAAATVSSIDAARCRLRAHDRRGRLRRRNRGGVPAVRGSGPWWPSSASFSSRKSQAAPLTVAAESLLFRRPRPASSPPRGEGAAPVSFPLNCSSLRTSMKCRPVVEVGTISTHTSLSVGIHGATPEARAAAISASVSRMRALPCSTTDHASSLRIPSVSKATFGLIASSASLVPGPCAGTPGGPRWSS